MPEEVNYRKLFAKKARIKKQWLQICPSLNNDSGIYVLIREENGIKYGYVGQSLNILDRLCSHSEGFTQHIDRSLKNHKLYSDKNPTGWRVMFRNFPPEQLDEKEQYYIRMFANEGYQLRNKTSGSQGEGKQGINDNAQAKGYREGIVRGYEKLRKELNKIIDKYLIISLKKENKLSQRMLEKFNTLLKGE